MNAIRSRPLYPGLTLAPKARRHIFALEGAGAGALAGLCPLPAEAAARAEVLFLPVAEAAPGADAALGRSGLPVWTAAGIAPLLGRLGVILSRAHMGTRLYAAGSEGFIGQVVALAQAHGVDPASVLTEQRGTLARRVQCVHCKGFTEGVTTTPFSCSHCGLSLFVRDHFSRRLGAFQGVCVDAEEPGDLPAVEELYR